MDRDLVAADIPKIDERGKRVVVHSTRHTFATQLSLAGVAPRVAQVAQEAMRHSDIALTMKHYTDAAQIDVAAAVDSLPSFAAGSSWAPENAQFWQTGAKWVNSWQVVGRYTVG